MAAGGGSGNGGGGGNGGANTQNQPWAWLGLLKWTLAHQGGDGTVPSEDSPTLQQLSDEDKAFLETVMADGIVDEGERMHVILQQFSIAMEYYQTKQQQQQAAAAAATEPATELAAVAENEATTEETHTEPSIDGVPPPNTEEIEDLLQELRDIVEQIDYARGFVNMKGCQYLLGAIGVPVPVIPTGIRNLCLGIMATLAQNNPPVQKEFVELGAIKVLSNMLLPEERKHDDDNGNDNDNNDDGVVPFPLSTKVKIMQALSAIVRCYDVTESVFEALPQAPSILCEGLVSSSWSLQLKTLFFVRAFLTSDTATNTRAVRFRNAIAIVANTDADGSYLKCGLKTSTADEDGTRTNNSNAYLAMQIRESSIELLQQLLQRRFAVSLLLEQKHHLAAFGVQRIQTLRSLTTTNKNNDDDNTDDDKESTEQELRNWESFLIQLARTVPEK